MLTVMEAGRKMIMHMQKEKQILFPYIDALERVVNAHGSIEPPFFQTVKNPIHAMMQEYDAADNVLFPCAVELEASATHERV